MKTPNELFGIVAECGRTAKANIIKLMKDHNVTSINTKVYIMDYGFDYIDISVYDRKMDAMFYDMVSMVTLDKKDEVHLFYEGEGSGECYDPTTTDWMNVYSLIYDIFDNVDRAGVGLITEKEEEEIYFEED